MSKYRPDILLHSCLDLVLSQEATIAASCTPQPTFIPTDHELVCTALTFPSTPVPPMPAPRHTRRLDKINMKLSPKTCWKKVWRLSRQSRVLTNHVEKLDREVLRST